MKSEIRDPFQKKTTTSLDELSSICLDKRLGSCPSALMGQSPLDQQCQSHAERGISENDAMADLGLARQKQVSVWSLCVLVILSEQGVVSASGQC